jgi:hypothetical protein
MVRRGVRGGGGARRAGPAVGRLLRLSLVSRDGARVVRGRADGLAYEPAPRFDQGRPRGTPRRRQRVYGRYASDDRTGRLADDGLPDAGSRAVPVLHLYPAGPVPAARDRGRPGVARGPGQGRGAGRPDHRGAGKPGSDAGRGRSEHRIGGRRGAGRRGRRRPGRARFHCRSGLAGRPRGRRHWVGRRPASARVRRSRAGARPRL